MTAADLRWRLRRGGGRSPDPSGWRACGSGWSHSVATSTSTAIRVRARVSLSQFRGGLREGAEVDCWRLLLVDDHALFREGLAGLFAYQDDFKVVGEAGDAETAIKQMSALHPDIV